MTREEEVRQVLYRYLEAGLVEHDVAGVMACVARDVMGFGMGEQGFVASWTDMQEIMRTGQKDSSDATYTLEFPKLSIRFPRDGVACVCAQVTLRMRSGGKTAESGLMQSLTMVCEDGVWRIAALHASPVMLSPESITAYPLRYAENTLMHLRDELQKETFDLMNHSISGGILSCYRNAAAPALYFVNDSLLRNLRYTREEFTQRYRDDVLQAFHPEDRRRVLDAVREASKAGGDYHVQARMARKDGVTRWMVAQGRVSADDSGNDILVNVLTDITEMAEMQERLERQALELEAQAKELSISEERFRIALEKSSSIIFDYDVASGSIVHSGKRKNSAEFVTSVADAQDTLISGGRILDGFLEEFNWTFEALRRGAPQASCTVKARLDTGRDAWYRISLTGITDALGHTVRAIGMIEDVTQEKEAEIAFAREELYRRAILADALAYYVINFTTGICESCKISSDGYCLPVDAGDPYDTVILEESRTRLGDSDRKAFLGMFMRGAVLDRYQHGETECDLEYRMYTDSGKDMWMQTTLHVIPDSATGELKGFMYVTDIDKKKRKELELMRRSEQDSMTGLFHKKAAAARITEALKTYEGIQSGVFIMVDVDQFKEINDHRGHPFGDKVLVGVAQVLRESFRDNDIVARLGGDEFAVFLCGMRSPERIRQSAQAILDGVRGLAAEVGENVTCSIGIALCAGVAKSFSQVYQEADTAMYTAKKNGRNRYAFYEDRGMVEKDADRAPV